MPSLPTGLVRDPKSGIYSLRRRIPKDLLASYGGKKKEIIFSLHTSNYRAAVERHRKEEARLTAEWELRRDQRAQHFAQNQLQTATVIDGLTEEQLERICSHYEAASLASDETRREKNQFSIEDIDEYQQGYSQANAVLKAAVAIGDIDILRPVLEQFLSLYRYELNAPESDFRRLALAFGRAAIRTNEKLLRRYDGQDVPTPIIHIEDTSEPKLSHVITDYISRYKKRGHVAMLKKVEAVLPLFLEVIGDKFIKNIRQSDIIDFFDVIQKLPPRWKDICRQQKISVREAVSLGLGDMSPGTFNNSYMAAINPFLADTYTFWQDKGWPTTLTTRGIRYTGSRSDGESQQRSLVIEELQRLFDGPEMANFARTPASAHKYWFPLVCLFTGARANEICQLNPQTDIKTDKKTGIVYLDISEIAEGDDRVSKSVKNIASKRKVPIHSQLIKLGFLNYVEHVKNRGDKLLFAQFPPSVGRAAPKAIKWFGVFLTELGLRDITPHSRVVGIHAIRSTFLAWAQASGVVNAEAITGHATNITEITQIKEGQVEAEASQVVRKYRGELPLKNKAEILAKIQYEGLRFHVPVSLS